MPNGGYWQRSSAGWKVQSIPKTISGTLELQLDTYDMQTLFKNNKWFFLLVFRCFESQYQGFPKIVQYQTH